MKATFSQDLSNNDLLELNQLGLIPGPDENIEAFAKRAEYCLNLQQHLSEELKITLKDDGVDDQHSHEILSKANHTLQEMYDISPSWIPLFFSNYQLSPWHGGCAWIFQQTEETPTAALIQMREHLRTVPTYLGFYHRDELLAHELTHVGRMMYQEPKYEELLAYKTSLSPFRRWFGGIVQSSRESVVFVLLLFIMIMFDIFLLMLHDPSTHLLVLWSKIIPIGLVTLALLRLWCRHNTLNACLQNLKSCLGNMKTAQAVLYRLRDREIDHFATMSSKEIYAYATTNAQDELRWFVITKAYFHAPN